MSATGRGAARRADDFYASPGWAVDAILPHLPLEGRILEPCAGTGAVLERLRAAGVAPSAMTAIELDGRRAFDCRHRTGVVVANEDGLATRVPGVDLVVTNPPYGLALEFARWSLEQVRQGGTVALLLRLGFLASAARASFHRDHPSDLFVLPVRPSFTGAGTDSADYAWFVWGPGRGRRWTLLPQPSEQAQLSLIEGAS